MSSNPHNPFETLPIYDRSTSQINVNPYESDYKTYKYEPKFSNISEISSEKVRKYQKVEQNIEVLKHDILYAAHSTSNNAKKTIVELDSQGQIITDVQPEIKQIGKKLEKSDTILGIIQNKFNKFALWKTNTHPKPTNSVSLPSQKNNKNNRHNKIQNDEDIEDEVDKIIGRKITEDEFCDVLISQLKDIKKVNNDIGKELSAQNNALNSMNNTIDVEIKHADHLNKRINRLIR